MSALFTQSHKNGEKTSLLIDVENGSVGSALARISTKEPPKLFGENRIPLPILHPLSSAKLAQEIDRAVEEALMRTGEVAAGLRANPATEKIGQITDAKIFLSAPWVGTTQGSKGIRFGYEPEMLAMLHASAGIITSNAPVSFYPFSRAAATAAYAYLESDSLLCIVTGEIVELVLVNGAQVHGRATLPLGIHTVLRTLQSHAGISLHEAHSALKLTHQAGNPTHVYAEPLTAASAHFAREFISAAEALLEDSGARTILVIAPEPLGDWFARALTRHTSATVLFPEGGVVRALRPKHCMQFIAAHAPMPDLGLMIETMFISTEHAASTRGV